MRGLNFFLFISVFIYSCKSDLEKIDINNVEAHRAYQDTIINKDSTLNGKFIKVKELISEYANLNAKENISNSNYNYYLARLYGKVDDFPLKGFWIDTIENKFLKDKEYSNYYDSIYYYTEKSLQIDKDNIRSMFLLSRMFYIERLRYEYDRSIVPVSYNRDSKKWSGRLDFIINNAIRFQKLDTTRNKYLSRGICEVALNFIDKQLSLDGYRFDDTKENVVNTFYMFGQLWDYVKTNESVVLSFDKEFIQNKVYPNVILARNFIREKELMAIRQKKRVDGMLNMHPRMFDYYFETNGVSVGLATFLKFNRNGTYQWGGWDYDQTKTDGSKIYTIMNTKSFEVVDSESILLKNFFLDSGNDLVVRYTVFGIFGVNNIVLKGVMSNGAITRDEALWFSSPPLD